MVDGHGGGVGDILPHGSLVLPVLGKVAHFDAFITQVDVAQMLITWKADVSVARPDGKTALMFASQHGHCAIVHTLLARGADPGIKSKAGETALTFLERSLEKYRNRKNSSNQTATETLKDCTEALHALTLPLNARHQRDDGEI